MSFHLKAQWRTEMSAPNISSPKIENSVIYSPSICFGELSFKFIRTKHFKKWSFNIFTTPLIFGKCLLVVSEIDKDTFVPSS